MFVRKCLGIIATGLLLAACGGSGGNSAEGTFTLIEFLESGKDSIPRNRILTFKFSAPVAEAQDFFERLKIENVQTGANSNFSRAIGLYLVTGDEVTFVPRLPEKPDRSDSGLRRNGSYVVFLKAGPDALRSVNDDRIVSQQEFVFETSDVFEDPIPTEPPRALGLVARDPTDGDEFDISRIDPSPTSLEAADTATLIAANRVIEPGAGDDFTTPWQFDLQISEPIDPATVTTNNVEMFEIFSDVTATGETAPPSAPAGTFGTAVSFKVPINVATVQSIAADGTRTVAVRVTPLFALVDNSRYRIRFSGNILGIDFRKAFIGENGLTGDGVTIEEPGGIGYVAEFIVRDRGSIQGQRVVTFDPIEDGVDPEAGQTTNDPADFNSALYNPASDPGKAVGFLPDFGDGSDGPLAVSGGNTTVIDTGDTPNAGIGNPFQVEDINANDVYNKTSLSTDTVTYDSPEYFDLKLASLVVSGSATLRVIGTNPILFRVSGLVQINGTLDVSGDDGQDSGGGTATGGQAGAGGGDGGSSRRGAICRPNTSSCQSWAAFLNTCTQAQNSGPFSDAGEGPGRGHPGADAWSYGYQERNHHGTTGGGGGSHATAGTTGEDRRNAGGAPGTQGPSCASRSSSGGSPGWAANSSVIGVRGVAGPTYGDRVIVLVIWGGSGGGAGGALHGNTSWGSGGTRSGGAGGGGGGSLAIFAAGIVTSTGGIIDVSGGDGGQGSFASTTNGWVQPTGGGGGGAGGSLVIISGANITLAAALIDARGGTGGDRANVGTTTTTCNACNAGGDGGRGFIFLMDADGVIDGINPGTIGEYDTFAFGVLTISDFKADRFSSIAAITELFNVLSANPEYLPLDSANIVGTVAAGQVIRVFMSSARADIEEPLQPDLTTEIGRIEMAVVSFVAGSVTTTVTGDMSQLNPGGDPMRDGFLRIDARFEYSNAVEAALGPLATIDLVAIDLQFNG